MEDRVNYTVVGFFVVLLTIATLSIGYWLSTGRQYKNYNNYVIYMKEPVAGLNVMAPVKYNGVVVGYVSDISLDQDNPQLVRLVLGIEENTPVTESTVATLRSQGITGITYIGLKAKTPSAPRLTAKPGQRYPIIPVEPSLLVYVSDALRSVSENVNNVSERIEDLFNEESVNDLKATFRNISQVTKAIADNSKEIDASLKSVTRLLHNASVASEELPVVMKDVKKTIRSIDAMAIQLKQAGKRVAETMKDGRIIVNNLSQQAMPSVVRTLVDLENVTENLQRITTELQHNPSMIVRGKQAAQPGPGER